MDTIEDLLLKVERLDPNEIRQRLITLEDQQKALRVILRATLKAQENRGLCDRGTA